MLAIIDYGSGNLRSVAKAFEHVGEGADIRVTQTPDVIKQASHIVLPGVGAFADCMRGLSSLPGMLEALHEKVLTQGIHFLGICVGMQMLFETGYEHGVHKGLGWVEGEVVPIEPTHPTLKVPHMGWNDLSLTRDHPLFENMDNDPQAYFVHSYHARCKHKKDVAATTEYGQLITAVIAKDNIMGTQFHPEKSQAAGLTLLKNFMSM